MKDLLLNFFGKSDDCVLLAFVLAFPLLGAFVNGIFGRRLGREAVRLMALAALGLSFAAAAVTFVALDATTPHKLSWLAWDWMKVNARPGEPMVDIPLKFSVDPLSGVMMLVITGVGFLIHVYASDYMREDKAYWRFFAYLNLFVFSMLVLVLGDNLPVLFVGWEGVGLCSYLLIGFWYTKTPNASAGKKAFIANRIGDFGLICAMFLLVYYTGKLDWSGIAANAQALVTPGAAQQVHLWPIGGGQFQDANLGFLKIPLHLLQPDKAITITAATAVGLSLFLGCTGKSAQIPLYVWLPDAMAGPTPVSALIHAATMVTAGIYLICRLSFVFVLSPAVMTIIAFTGAATALLAASIALVQNDIKKVLAYSTVSQLGFMFIGVGSGAFTAGFFHVFTHAFFKACLFLGAGSVIHAMHARVHDDERSQDMRNMGGLRKYMPLTYGTFAASTLAIIGFPLTSGWFSKDEILAMTLVNKPTHPYAEQLAKRGSDLVWTAPSWVPWMIWGMGILAATMTAFYMCRCLFLTFWGDFRGWTIGRPSMVSGHDHAAHDHDAHADDDDDHPHHEEDLSQPGPPPHESPRPMTIPLLVLGTAAIVAGLVLNPAAVKIFKHDFAYLPMEHWLEPVFEEAKKGVKPWGDEHAMHTRELISLVFAFLAFAVGSGVSYWMYVLQQGRPARELAAKVPALYQAALDKWRVDEAYDKTILGGVDALADTAASVDQGVVDLIIARLTSLTVAALGTVLRTFQNGVVHVYAAAMVVGLAVLGWFFTSAHADISVQDNANGDYVLTAGPGPGYAYQWFPEAGGKPTTPVASAVDTLKIHLEEGKSQTVRLVVVNTFDRSNAREITLSRPRAGDKADKTAQLPGAPSGER
jgi:NADH-quinone oxidoreductase subunit L